MKNLHLYYKWVSMNIFNRNQIIDVLLSDCVDEFGNSFGKNGDHFFIKVLKYNTNTKQAKNFLKKYYSKNIILSVNQILGKKIKSKYGDMYFCPWEESRIRPLSKFSQSHKVGPTPEIYLDKIINRLFDLYFKIKKDGFNKIFKLNNYPRCFKIQMNNRKTLYLCRDGQHRLAILSYLGFKKIKICYESDFWYQPSFIKFLTKTKNSNNQLKIIDPNFAANWPHVKLNNISKEDAVNYFYKKFKLKNINND